MGFLSSLLGKSRNPADAASPYLNQVAPMAKQNLQPFVDRGAQAGNVAQGQYNQLTEDPTGFLNELFSNYSMSEGFKNRRNESLRASSDAARTGGFAGTYGDQKLQGEIADSLASQGMQEWLNNVLNVYGTGLTGQQHVADQGYQASTGLTDALGNSLGAQAGLAFQGQAQKNQNKTDLMRTILNGLGAGAQFAGNSEMSLFGKKIW